MNIIKTIKRGIFMDKKERYERYKYLTGLSALEIASYQDKKIIWKK